MESEGTCDMLITINPGEPNEYKLPFMQAMELGRRLAEFKNPMWHWNDCQCCITVHEDLDGEDDHAKVDRAYIIDSNGGTTLAERDERGEMQLSEVDGGEAR